MNSAYRSSLSDELRSRSWRSGGGLAVFTVILAVFARQAFQYPGATLLYFGSLGLIAIDLALLVGLVHLLRLIGRDRRRPLARRIELTSQGVRVTLEGASGSVAIPYEPERVFVSPPGFNPPVRLRDGGWRPRAFVRIVPIPSHGSEQMFPVPDEAARAVHARMAERFSFSHYRYPGPSPPSRHWLQYSTDGSAGEATGSVTSVSSADLWHPKTNEAIDFQSRSAS